MYFLDIMYYRKRVLLSFREVIVVHRLVVQVLRKQDTEEGADSDDQRLIFRLRSEPAPPS